MLVNLSCRKDNELNSNLKSKKFNFRLIGAVLKESVMMKMNV